MNGEVISKACLGRPFEIGILYDCRTDQLISGISLWDLAAIKGATETSSLSDSGYEVITADSLVERASHFGVDSQLQFSLLTGLVRALGSGNYVCDFTSSEKHACACLKYWNTSKYEYIQIDQLGNMEYAAYGRLATHIVIQIVYGLEIILKFIRPLDKDENLDETNKILRNMVKSVAENENFDSHKSEIDKCFCTCYRDDYPTEKFDNAWEAIELYYKLVHNANQQIKIQKRALLFPLNKLCINAPKLVEIPTSLTGKAEAVISMYVNIQIKVEKLLKNDTCAFIPGYKFQLLSYKEMVENYETLLRSKLAVLLPHMREGKIPVCKVEDVMNDIQSSPFNPQRLIQWIDNKQTELKELELVAMHLKHLQMISTAQEFQTLASSVVFCFCLSFVKFDKSYLNSMYKHMYSQQNVEVDSCNGSPDNLPWYENKMLLSKLKTYSANFKEFCMENQNKNGIKFVLLLSDEILLKNESKLNTQDSEFTWLCKDGVTILFEPPSVPGVPSTSNRSYDSISLEWSEPEYGVKGLINYTVAYQKVDKEIDKKVWQKKHTVKAENTLHVNSLEPDTMYYFEVIANYTNGTRMNNKNHIRIKTAPLPLAHRTKKKSTFIKKMPPDIYQLNMKVDYNDTTGLVSWQSFGNPPLMATKKKVLIVVGATGAGKTTLINGMVNYIFKVEWIDNFRFKLVVDEGKETQAKSQTTWITAYTFYKAEDSPIDYTLTIIDTPGFGDTSGLKRDKEITEQIRKMFTSNGPYSIDQLDGIGFVVQASAARLTHTQQYIYDSILSIFGKDVSENIFILTTFSDGQEPPVLAAIKSAKIPYNKHFKFNNSALFVHSDRNTAATGNFNKMFWDMGYDSFELFFKSFNTINTKTLKMTRQVLTERQQLEVAVIGFQEQVNIGLSKLKQMQAEERVLLKHVADIEANKEFEYTIDEDRDERIPITNEFVTNCLKCNFTCHYPCGIAHDEDKHGCAAMRGSGESARCGVCPGTCHWRDHYNKNYRIITTKKKVTKTSSDLKSKYNSAIEGKTEVESMVANITEALEYVHDQILQRVQKTQQCLNRLDEIALKPNPLTETEYIELLIQSEEREAKDGYQDRIAFYQDALDQAKIMSGAKNFNVEESIKTKKVEKEKGSKGWLHKLTWWRN